MLLTQELIQKFADAITQVTGLVAKVDKRKVTLPVLPIKVFDFEEQVIRSNLLSKHAYELLAAQPGLKDTALVHDIDRPSLTIAPDTEEALLLVAKTVGAFTQLYWRQGYATQYDGIVIPESHLHHILANLGEDRVDFMLDNSVVTVAQRRVRAITKYMELIGRLYPTIKIVDKNAFELPKGDELTRLLCFLTHAWVMELNPRFTVAVKSLMDECGTTPVGNHFFTTLMIKLRIVLPNNVNDGVVAVHSPVVGHCIENLFHHVKDSTDAIGALSTLFHVERTGNDGYSTSFNLRKILTLKNPESIKVLTSFASTFICPVTPVGSAMWPVSSKTLPKDHWLAEFINEPYGAYLTYGNRDSESFSVFTPLSSVVDAIIAKANHEYTIAIHGRCFVLANVGKWSELS